MSQPLVSIILCTFDGANFLRDQLHSLVSQTYKNIEVIVLDDVSTDKTVEVINEFKEFKDFRVYINDWNLGLNANFSKGVSLSNGEYIAFCDQDDIWEFNKIETLMNLIDDNHLIYHNSQYIDENNNYLPVTVADLHHFVEGSCSHLLIYQNCISGHAILVRRSFLQSILPVPAGIYYDWYISFHAAETGKIKFTKIPLVKYRVHGASYTQKNPSTTLKQRRDILNILEKVSVIRKGYAFELLTVLKDLYNRKETGNSLPLLFFLLRHYNNLFYIRKRSIYSKIRNIFKEALLR